MFTELIEKTGVKGVQVEELWDLSAENLDRLKPVHGLIFLFKWQRETDTRPVVNPPNVFFAKQVIQNACATQALINILMNCPSVELGSELNNYKQFAMALPPDERGYVLNDSAVIREVHNSFARADPFPSDDQKPQDGEEGEAFHFVGYVPVDGHLYELDGLKRGPILLGECTEDNWLTKAAPAIQQRIDKYSSQEIRFNLLALIEDRREVLTRQITELRAAKDAACASSSSMDTTDDTVTAALDLEISDLERQLSEEKDKRARWTVENTRRRHNYVPLLYNLLKLMAQKGQLEGLQSRAKEAYESRQKAKQAKPAAGASAAKP